MKFILKILFVAAAQVLATTHGRMLKLVWVDVLYNNPACNGEPISRGTSGFMLLDTCILSQNKSLYMTRAEDILSMTTYKSPDCDPLTAGTTGTVNITEESVKCNTSRRRFIYDEIDSSEVGVLRSFRTLDNSFSFESACSLADSQPPQAPFDIATSLNVIVKIGSCAPLLEVNQSVLFLKDELRYFSGSKLCQGDGDKDSPCLIEHGFHHWMPSSEFFGFPTENPTPSNSSPLWPNFIVQALLTAGIQLHFSY